jgi:hypothetical protein
MAKADVSVVLAAEFVGKKAFNDALKSTVSLQSQVKSLAKSYLGLFTVQKLASQGIQAAKAFAADEAAALRLSTAVDNLGISFANPEIATFISNLENSAKIADDVLRPAFQGLLTTTGSLTQSQKLLNDAITISRGTGVELATVAQDLANGYVGITRGLKKYNTGLTTSELSTKSFSEVLGVLLEQSSGAANAYLDTTSFKFDALTVATDNAREMIGKGLVEALARAGGGAEAKDATKAIDLFAASIYNLEIRLGGAIGAIPTLLSKLKALPKEIFMGFAGKQLGVNLTPTPNETKPPVPSKTQQQILLEKLEKEAAARAKKLYDMQVKAAKALVASQKKADALKKAGTLFDLEQTQIVAALKGKISEDERKRLELQLALITGNTTEASKLAGELGKAQGLSAGLIAYLKDLPDAKNPFAGWAAYLDAIEAQVKRIAVSGATGGGGSSAAITSNFGNIGLGDMTDFIPANPRQTAFSPAQNAGSPVSVVVMLDGQEMTNAISRVQTNNSLSGDRISVNRRTGTFATL